MLIKSQQKKVMFLENQTLALLNKTGFLEKGTLKHNVAKTKPKVVRRC